MEQLTQAQKAQKTRQANASKRKAKEEQAKREYTLMRQRLIQIIDNADTSDAQALKAIEILHDMDEKRRF